MTYLYVIGPRGGPYKIGSSANPRRRLGDFRTASHRELHLHHVEPVHCPEAILRERYAHHLLKCSRLEGEWFRAARSDAISAVRAAAMADEQEMRQALRLKVVGSRPTAFDLPLVDLRGLRQSFGMSQAQFAQRYRLKIGTLRDWEQRRTFPPAWARLYLALIRHSPDAVDRAIQG